MDKISWEAAMSAIQEAAKEWTVLAERYSVTASQRRPEGVCPLCGGTLSDPMSDVEDNTATTTCPGCGDIVPADSSFCPKCGTELDVSEPGEL